MDSLKPTPSGCAGSVPDRSLVSSKEPPEPSKGGCEPSVADTSLVLCITWSLATVDPVHGLRARPLSHPGPVWRRGEVGDHPNPGDKEKFTELLSLLDNLELMSNIVTP